MSTTVGSRTGTSPTTLLRVLQAFALLSVINLVFQFVTAGELVGGGPGGPGGGGEGLEDIHGTGAIVLHVLTGLATVAAGLYWRVSRGPLWPTVLAAVVFVLSFVQAYVGDRETLYLHVPGAIVLTIGSVWILAWSFTRSALPRA